MPLVEIPRDYTLLVEGPSKVTVVKGKLDSFGAEIEEGEVVTVEPFRALPLYASGEAKVDLEHGKFWFVRGRTVPESWVKAAEEIASTGPKRILVVGDIDSGKTAFSTLLLNTLVREGGRKIAVIDADVGQKSIGPPGALGMGLAEQPAVSLSSVAFEDGFFIGSFTPAGLLHRAVVGALLLSRKAEALGADTVLVDTAGWVHEWGGRELKLTEALALQPDFIVFVGAEEELSQVYKPISGLFPSVRVDSPSVLRRRSREERREYRRYLYRRWFSGALERIVTLDKYRLLFTLLFNGIPLSSDEVKKAESFLGSRVKFAERVENSLILFTDEAPKRDVELLKAMFSASEVHILSGSEILYNVVAFSSREKYLEGLGIVTSLDPAGKTMRVFTTVEPKEGMVIMAGSFKLNPISFEEILVEKTSFL
ncbi:MAG: Clp1/GlmU family protein [Thermofilum sp.]